MNCGARGREWSWTAPLPCSHLGEKQAGLCSLRHRGCGAGVWSQKLSRCCFSSYAPAVSSSHLLRDPSNAHEEAKENRKAKDAGPVVGQGKWSSLPPSLHTGRRDFFSLASWFCPQNAQRAAHPRLLPPPAWGNWDSGRKAVLVTVSQGSVLLIQNKFWISSAGL